MTSHFIWYELLTSNPTAAAAFYSALLGLATVHRARRLLDQFEAVWRARVDQLDSLLSDPREGDG